MQTPELPSLGTHLILDFVDVTTIDVNDLQLLISRLSALICDLGDVIEQIYHKKFSSGSISIVFMLSNSQLTLHTFPSTYSYSIDYHLFEEEDVMEKLRKTEELFCDEFGWKNCISSIFLQRGKATQFFLNNDCNVGTIFKNMKFVWRERSKFQDIRVYDTLEMGRILILDGNIQISNELEDNYTKDMTQYIVQKDIEYNEILIIGGGDLVICTYLLENYPNIKHITVVEIDDRVCEVVKKYFSSGETAKKEIETGRFTLIFNDGAEFAKQALFEKKKFDGIIIDCTDVDVEDSAACSLFTVPFYQNILHLLNKNALFSQQVSDVQSKVKFEKMVYEAGFRETKIVFSDTPEYSVSLPIGIAKNTLSD
jgi:spermidine synthase